MRKLVKRVIQVAAVTSFAFSGVAVTAGAASASSDSYCQHGTCVSGNNNFVSGGTGQWANGGICNYQSSANSFVVWMTDALNGDYVVKPQTTPMLNPGQCFSYGGWVHNGDYVQVFARSGGLWSYGTDPIAPSLV
ncbi:hypothetical protein AB0G73_28300 [Streptomyces sp. NPDC020719]|uniref:hypothetical protein n=1 Tax=Streptomyces sp. NPDC020719 TaxID=3154896 RepID=UPI0033E5E97F